MWIFPTLALVFFVVAITRPGPSRLLRRRGTRPRKQEYQPLRPIRQRTDSTIGLRDPSRPL